MTRCGFPNVTMNTSNVDVGVVFFDKVNETYFDPSINYPFDDNQTTSFSAGSSNSVFNLKYPGMDDNTTNTCNKTRNMYLVITNVQKPAQLQ